MHLFIFEDFTLKQSVEDPEPADYEAVDDGLLDIVRWDPIAESFQQYHQGHWVNLDHTRKEEDGSSV